MRRLTLLGALLFAASLAQAQSIDTLAWLSGSWLQTTENSQTEELWTAPRGQMMAGANTSLRGTRASYEFLRIVERDGRLLLLVSPEGRQPPTEFMLKESGASRVVFENPTHDFPTRVVYSREGDTLTARIEGQLRGQPRSMQWTFQRR